MVLKVGIAPNIDWLYIAKPLLDQALKLDTSSCWDDVLTEYKADHAQLWLAVDDEILAAVITRYLPEEHTIELWLCGGKDVKKWVNQIIAAISDWAKVGNCKKLRIIGRLGWKRILPDWSVKSESNGLALMERMLV